MNDIDKPNGQHSTKIIGFGHVASNILSRLDDVNADKFVFVFKGWHGDEDEDYSYIEYGNCVEIDLYLGGGCPCPDENHAKEYASIIEENDFLASIFEGAKHVVFVVPLPSMGGYVLSDLLMRHIDFLLFKDVRFDAILQLPFPFEGKRRCDRANELCQTIEQYVNTNSYDLERAVNGHSGYHGKSINELFEYADKLMRTRIRECLSGDFSVPVIAIDRHRIGVDGDGVTTLVCFQGCSLRCKYCLNNICFKPSEVFPRYTPMRLYETVKVDNLYFLASGGGVCFGGGEPLLRMDFISDFKMICGKRWKLTVETSLNVPSVAINEAARVVDAFIVDIKESNPEIYKAYTGGNCELAWRNLELLLSLVGAERIHVRVPRIPGYNDDGNIECTVEKLTELGLTKIECFEYLTDDVNGNTNQFPDMGDVIVNRDENKDGHHQLLGIPSRPFEFIKRIFLDGDIDDNT